jgi:hypothetical protein
MNFGQNRNKKYSSQIPDALTEAHLMSSLAISLGNIEWPCSECSCLIPEGCKDYIMYSVKSSRLNWGSMSLRQTTDLPQAEFDGVMQYPR